MKLSAFRAPGTDQLLKIFCVEMKPPSSDVLGSLHRLYLKFWRTYEPRSVFKGMLLLHMMVFFKKLQVSNPFASTASKISRYWGQKTVKELLDEADALFVEEKYLEVYDMLNRLKFYDNVDVFWRICRVLYKLSSETFVNSHAQGEMIDEAYDLISRAVELDDRNSEVHKWMAVLTDAKYGLEGLAPRMKTFPAVKRHLERAADLNPQDFAVFYMLGQWCFTMSNLSWFQRKFCSYVFLMELPTATYEEAYYYFQRAEHLRPRLYLPNLYMLGRTSYHLKHYFRACHYLNIAAHLPPRTGFEKKCACEAKSLSNKIQRFDVSRDALFHGLRVDNMDFDSDI